MISDQTYKQVLQPFICKNQADTVTKLKHFTQQGSKHLHLVLDFDRTITKSENAGSNDTSSWLILTKYLPSEAMEQYTHLFETYRPLEIAGKMTTEDAVAWWEGCLSIYTHHQVNINHLESDIAESMPMRHGIKELFDYCKQQYIPTIILSAGIKDIIDTWFRMHNISPTLVMSTQLKINESGSIIGWDKNTLIHTMNKNEMGHHELTKIRQERDNTILIGDSIDDAKMVTGDESVLRIRIFDPRKDDGINRDAYIQQTFDKYDLIIESGSLSPVVDILDHIPRTY